MLGRRIALLAAVTGLCLGLLSGFGPLSPAVLAAQGTPCPEATGDELEEIATGWFAAVNERNFDALAELAAPEVTHHSRFGGEAASIDAVQAGFQTLIDAFPDAHSTINMVLTDAPLAVVHFTGTGTQATEFRGTDPTGEATTWEGMNLFRIECGKVVEVRSQVDQLARINQGMSVPATPVAMADDAEAGSPAACPALTDEAAAALMDAWYGDIWTGDIAELEAITTGDIYHHWAEGPDTSGQAAQREKVELLSGILAGMTSTYDNMVVDGDIIAVSWEQSLDEYTWHGLNIFRTECGQIAEVWSEMDLSELPPRE